MKSFYDETTLRISKVVTNRYSTSFSFATSLMNKEHRNAIYAIYGFVRFADEIVDTFHDWNKEELLSKFEEDLKFSIEKKISINPILNSFQLVVNKYNIPYKFINSFFDSMKADLQKMEYISKTETDNYIYGSAEVVGLMCLCVFCDGDTTLFQKLEKPAMKLGSAFQKVNFLRDLKNDIEVLNRNYFPEIRKDNFSNEDKLAVIHEIELEFTEALSGLKQLPADVKTAVYVAFLYYKMLLKKLKSTPAAAIFKSRVRVSNAKKIIILIKAYFQVKTKLI
ncbi:MAG: phytoene/squalene synthase family protein [Prolixibacteraceae bacterium]|nr:phytoene/squalene synthase family protein [Prolixibacteraceae bacterium]